MGNTHPARESSKSSSTAMKESQTQAATPSWLLNPGSGVGKKGLKKVSRNIFVCKNGKGYRVWFRGPDPLTGERVQRSKQFPPDFPLEEIEARLATWRRNHEIWKLVLKQIRREDRRKGRPVTPFSPPRRTYQFGGPLAVKWVTVATGIKKSDYGWWAQWRETDPLTGERVERNKTWKTKVPPGESERPPDYVMRFREQRRREGLEGRRSRWDLPKKNVREIRIPPAAPHTPSFAVQFKRLLKEARLSLRGAALFFDVEKRTIQRHSNGHRPTRRLVLIYEEKLSKRLGRPVSFVL